MMILHNLKAACRNLMKYRTQTIVSVVAIAVGIVTLAATHFVLKHLGMPSIANEPYYERCYVMRFGEIEQTPVNVEESNNPKEISFTHLGVRVNQEMESALKADGGLPGVEKIIRNSYIGGLTRGSDMTFTMPDSTTRTFASSFNILQAEALNFHSIRSALSGEKIPILKDGEVVISDMIARKVYGKKNPIGCRVSMWAFGELRSATIRDVYKAEQLTDQVRNSLYIHYDEDYEDYVVELCMILADGQSPEAVRREADRRLEHLGIKTSDFRPLKEVNKEVWSYLLFVRVIVYIISSLILIAALIGFLKMQLQQFALRRREVSLRRVHGAKRGSLFTLFLTEVWLIILMATGAAYLLAAIFIDYSNKYLVAYLDEFGWQIEGVYQTILLIAVCVAVICSIVVMINIKGLHNSRQAMAAQMHRNRRHTLRNSMLGLQLFVSVLFLGGTIALSQLIGLFKEQKNIPANDDFYAQCISVCPAKVGTDSQKLIEYLQTEAKGIKQYITINEDYTQLEELMNSEEANELFAYNTFFRTLQVSDTAILEFWQRPIKWLLPPEERHNCMLLSDSLYSKLSRLGVTDKGSLLVRSRHSFPIGGTYSVLPYMDNNSGFMINNIVELGSESIYATKIIVVPEEGEYERVFTNLEDIMLRINPQPVRPTVVNLRKELTSELFLLQNMQQGAWILSSICFVICFMGIWSSISLDTRSRMKEVAVRRVHGAKRKDIFILFGRLYLWLMGIASLFSIPLIIIYNNLLKDWARQESVSSDLLSPVMPIIISIAVCSLVTAAVVVMHICKMLAQQPADIIAKE